MAVIRQVSITGFKEVVVSLPSGDQAAGEQGQLLSYYYTSINNGIPTRINSANILLDYWGFFGPNSNERLYPNKTKDINNDGIPDYLSLDIDGDGFEDSIGNADFNGVIKKSYLLAAFRVKEYSDQNRTIPELYQAIAAGIGVPYNEQLAPAWVVIGESKPSFYYEKCYTSYNTTLYSGRIPVSKNYFDLDDIFISENPNGTWTLVTDDLQPIGQFQSPFAPPQGLTAMAAINGFDVNFGPDLEDITSPLPIRLIQQYMPFVINSVGMPTFPNINPNRAGYLDYIGTIKTNVNPVNLHIATRQDILSEYQKLNTTDTSARPFNPDYYAIFPDIPQNIPFSDGAKERWGTPYIAIGRGFTLNDEKYKGECIPVPGDFEEPTQEEDELQPRVQVSIADVLSGRVSLDGTNYVRGIVTAHFTYPMASATMQDIADVYYAYEKMRNTVEPDFSEFWEPSKELHRSDILTFAREMRSAIYVQDETAGMELLGTDFYSTEGLSYQTAPGTFLVSSEVVTVGQPNTPSFESTKTLVSFANNDPSFIGPAYSVELFDVTGTGITGGSIRDTQKFNANIPITEYWETDTGYLPERYHIKVGDFIEIYNMNVLRRFYAPRTCKIVNNEYRIIPNPDLMNGEDVMEYFDRNGYIKDVTLADLYGGQKDRLLIPAYFDEWVNYDYSDLNSIHATEHCLIRVKNVAFIKNEVLSGPSLIVKSNSGTLLPNTDLRIVNREGTPLQPTSVEYDFGYRFEPGKKYPIAQIQEGQSFPTTVNGLDKAFVYNAPSTEMSQYLLKIPGQDIKDGAKDDAQNSYVNWVNDKKKTLPEGTILDEYEWPLTILGIQKYENFFDSFNSQTYMIMPRSMYDFGITSQNYSLFFPTGKDVYTVKSGSSSPTNPTGATGTTGRGSGTSTACFYKDTQILTPAGNKSIQDILVGDAVFCFDTNFNLHESIVTQTFIHDKDRIEDIYTYSLSNGVQLNVTQNHPVLTDSGNYAEIGSLSLGDYLIENTGDKVRIDCIEFFRTDIVYNIETERYHNYIANGICVHNKTATPPSMNDVVIDIDNKLDDIKRKIGI